jgi:hypothetical protein
MATKSEQQKKTPLHFAIDFSMVRGMNNEAATNA